MPRQRSVSRSISRRFFRKSSRALVGRGPLLEHPDEELREGQDPGERVVDLVRDRGGELSERRELLGLQELVLGALQGLGPFLHLLLEAVQELQPVGARLREGRRHVVQRLRELPQLVRRAGRNDGGELPARELLGDRHHPGDRLQDEAAENEAERQRDEDDDQHREPHRPERAGGRLGVHLAERDGDVRDAQDVLDRRGDVAPFGRADRLVVDRRHHPDDAMAVGGAVDAGARRHREADERLAGRVAGVAGLAFLVDHRPGLAGRGREHDPPFLVEDPDLLDLLAVGERLHDAVGLVLPAREHLVVGRRLDRVREDGRASDGVLLHLGALGADRHEGEERERCQRHAGHRGDHLDAQPPPPGESGLFHASGGARGLPVPAGARLKSGPSAPPEHDPNASGDRSSPRADSPRAAGYSVSRSFRAAASSFFFASSTFG